MGFGASDLRHSHFILYGIVKVSLSEDGFLIGKQVAGLLKGENKVELYTAPHRTWHFHYVNAYYLSRLI